MATFVLTDAVFIWAGTDLSDHVKQVTVDYGAEEQDDTFMGDSTRSATGGLKTWSMSVDFGQDFAAGEVDATFFSAVGSTGFVEVRPTSSAASATNPSYEGTALCTSYQPFGQSVGDLAGASVQLTAAGDLSRATS